MSLRDKTLHLASTLDASDPLRAKLISVLARLEIEVETKPIWAVDKSKMYPKLDRRGKINAIERIAGKGELASSNLGPIGVLFQTSHNVAASITDQTGMLVYRVPSMPGFYWANTQRPSGILLGDPSDAAFADLKDALKKYGPLPTEDGRARRVKADEFMLMQPEPVRGYWQFKHSDTRNYVFLNARSKQLLVPQTDKPFQRGFF